SNPPHDSCSFYVDCFKSCYHPQGYLLSYGMNFCKKFSDDHTGLRAEGQTWML
ncbi:hypothetical protein L208DRAFT_1332517, partial [Tricholoma matsutake]